MNAVAMAHVYAIEPLTFSIVGENWALVFPAQALLASGHLL